MKIFEYMVPIVLLALGCSGTLATDEKERKRNNIRGREAKEVGNNNLLEESSHLSDIRASPQVAISPTYSDYSDSAMQHKEKTKKAYKQTKSDSIDEKTSLEEHKQTSHTTAEPQESTDMRPQRRIKRVTQDKHHEKCLPPSIQYIVTCKDDSEYACLQELTEAGIRIIHMIPGTKFFAVCLNGKEDIPILMDLADVKDCEPDPRRRFTHVNESPSAMEEESHRRLNQITPYGIDLVRAPEFWNRYGRRGEGVTVCVIDTGFDGNHRDVVPSRLNGSNDSDLQVPWDEDGDSHGTHVAGTIGAADNDVDVVGVAPGANLFIARVFDDDGLFTASAVIDAVNECVRGGSSIISMSFGGVNGPEAERAAMQQFANQGILLVAAAGNSGNNANEPEFPASYDTVISVGGVDSESEIARFSTHNPWVDISAPGSRVESLKSGGGISIKSGTSMATPHVAGVAALLMSQFPNEPASRIREAMENTAVDLGPCGHDNLYGNGRVDVMAAANYLENGGRARRAQPNGCIETTVTTVTDDFGLETQWFIHSKASANAEIGEVVMRGGAYPNEIRATYTETFYLPSDGCYEYILKDKEHDGTCCQFGNGRHELVYNGERLLLETNFQTAELRFSFGCYECGNGIVEPGEECDNGNGNSNTGSCTLSCRNARCGDGFVQPGEECDDGNNNDRDSCTNACRNPRCGDGIVQAGEECDDGNNNNRDSCTNQCRNARCGDGFTQPGEECDNGNNNNNQGSCTQSCRNARCGDGFVQAGEECDQGNNNNNQGSCTLSCRHARCGDGFVQPGEQCDDGNNNNSDSCSNTCQSPQCGDGIVQAGEQCDDGNRNNNDGCTNTCMNPRCGDGIIQAGEECDNGNNNSNQGACTLSCRNARCGDGLVQAGEECDEGNNNSNQGSCTLTCRNARCGDGFVQAGEECDDGNNNNRDSCTNQCRNARCGDGFVQAGEECDNGNNNSNEGACTLSCQNARCGDGFVQPGEECDDGNSNNRDFCTNACQAARCGDGFVQPGEECDEGNDNNNLGSCTRGCKTARCGDGFVQPGEECDEGDEDNSNQGTCTKSCKLPRCGDGYIQADEQCDAGNKNSNQGACTRNCLIGSCGDGFVQEGEECDEGINNSDQGNCTSTCRLPRCGDGFIQAGEECDEGNKRNSNEGTCTLGCKNSTCGDGLIQAGEECDEGVNNSNQGNCTEACELARCGDGFVQEGEECDLGIGNSNMGMCTASCQKPRCGDGFIQASEGEECDDGNTSDGDGCSSTCQGETATASANNPVTLSSSSAFGLRGVASRLLLSAFSLFLF